MAAEDAGTISAEIRFKLDNMEKDALNAQRRVNQLAEKFKRQGEGSGKGFAAGMKSGFDQVDQHAARLGRNIGKSLAPQMLLLGAGIKVIQGIGSAFANAFSQNEKFSKGIADLKSSLGAGFTAAVRPVTDFFANLIDKAAKSMKQTKELKAALDSLNTDAFIGSATDLGKAFDDATKNYQTLLDEAYKAKKTFMEIQDDINSKKADSNYESSFAMSVDMDMLEEAERRMIDFQEQTEAAHNKLLEVIEMTGGASKEAQSAFSDAEKELKAAEAQIDFMRKQHAVSEEQANEMRLSALNNYINKSSELAAKENLNSGNIVDGIRAQIAARDKLQEKLKKAGQSDQEKIDEARLAAIEKYEKAERRARDARAAGHIDQLEMERQIQAALAQEYSDLESIALQYQLTAGKTVELRDAVAATVRANKENEQSLENQRKLTALVVGMEDDLAEQEIARQKALASSAATEAERDAAIGKAIELENRLIEKQRERAWEAIRQSEEYRAASDEERDAILANFDAITEGMKKVRDEARKDKGGNWLANALGISDEKLGHAMRIGDAAISAFESISDTALEISRQHTEEQIALVEKSLDTILGTIQKAREAELIAAGFAVRDSVESLEAQLEAAKRTGDEVLIYRLERRKQEQEINDKYDEQAKAAEEKAAHEKAEIEYRLAVAEHSQRKIAAANAGVMAVLQALQAAPPPYNFVLAGLSGAATAAQIGMLSANPPQPPQFRDGGIVPGRKSDGDVQHVVATAGEVILNEAQQSNLAAKLQGGGGVLPAHIYFMVDGKQMGKMFFDLAGDGHYYLKARAVR